MISKQELANANTEIARLRGKLNDQHREYMQIRYELKSEIDRLKGHRFIETSEELGSVLNAIRGKQGRTLIRRLHPVIGPLLDELDAAYQRWIKNEPGGRL